jgi:hypothetical protein
MEALVRIGLLYPGVASAVRVLVTEPKADGKAGAA